jgi:hypothetical protein
MKAAVFYYTQSGQALNVVRSICAPFDEVVYKQILPQHAYPFPWSRERFFDVFPETRLGLPPSGIETIDFADVADADVVIVAGQSWYLSPSLPLQSFFNDEQVRRYLRGRDVVFVNACRNMWLMTARKIKGYVKDVGARLVGHIVMQDGAANLVSVLTIIRWLMYGQKQGGGLLPAAGVSETDIAKASRFGELIRRSVEKNALHRLQPDLLAAGAIGYKPSILFLEKAGHRMFGLWARFIRRRGGLGNPDRRRRVDMFCAYILFVLFALSPFAQLFFYLTYPLQHVARHRAEDCGLD